MIVLTKAQRPSTVRLRATSQSAGPRGPTGASGAPGAPLLETRTAIATATIPTLAAGGPSFIYTAGYAVVGDGGHGLYRRYTGTPGNSTNPGNVRSLDGQYWRLVIQGPLPAACFGYKADYWTYDESNSTVVRSANASKTDNWQALMDAIRFATYDHEGNGFKRPCIQIPYGTGYVSDTIEFEGPLVFEGLGTGSLENSSSSVLIFAAGKAGLKWRHENNAPFWSNPHLRNFSLKSLGFGGNTAAHGLNLGKTATVEYVSIQGFGGNGVNINADVNGGTNANGFFLQRVSVFDNQGHGVYCVGGDSNAGCGIAVQAFGNGGWGIRDDSFLANAWIGCQADSNAGGPYYATGVNAPVTFIGCYAESNQPPSYAGDKVTFIGGTHAPGVDVSGGGLWQRGREMIGGTKSYYPGAGAFFKTAKTATTAYSFDYNDGQPFDWRHFGNYWGLQWANQTTSYGITSNENTGLGFGKPGPINASVVKAGTFWTSGGFAPSLLTVGVGRIFGYSDTTPPNGAHGAGEYVLNANGGSLMGYWNRTQGFTGGTWTNGASLFAPEFKKASNGNWYLMDNTNGTSTVEPTHTSGVVTGADGLRWTFLGTGDAEFVKVSALLFEVSTTVDLPSIVSGGSGAAASTQTVTVTGAQLGDFSEVSYQGDCQGMQFISWVSAANTVKWYPVNHTAGAIDLGNGTYRTRVRPRVT